MLKTNYESNACLLLETDLRWLLWRLGLLLRALKSGLWPVMQAGKTDAFYFSNHSHALVTFYVQFLCSDWSKFDRWVHVENLYSNLKLVYFDSWSWQSFERRENRGMHRNTGKLLYILGTYYGALHEILTFLTVFFRRMYKMKYSSYQESSVIHGWFV